MDQVIPHTGFKGRQHLFRKKWLESMRAKGANRDTKESHQRPSHQYLPCHIIHPLLWWKSVAFMENWLSERFVPIEPFARLVHEPNIKIFL
jgi:hypothetical protein